jgi:hypothetical protein
MAISFLLSSIVIAIVFYKVGRWSAFRIMVRRIRGERFWPTSLTPDALNFAVIDYPELKTTGSDLEKYANSVRHRQKFKRSQTSG